LEPLLEPLPEPLPELLELLELPELPELLLEPPPDPLPELPPPPPPPPLAYRGFTARPSANTDTAQSKDFLKFAMIILLKVKKVNCRSRLHRKLH
jgi:hypothetical protein